MSSSSVVVDSYENSFQKIQENYIQNLENKRKIIFKTIFSPDSLYQVQCDSDGNVLVWSIEKTLKNLDKIYIVKFNSNSKFSSVEFI